VAGFSNCSFFEVSDSKSSIADLLRLFDSGVVGIDELESNKLLANVEGVVTKVVDVVDVVDVVAVCVAVGVAEGFLDVSGAVFGVGVLAVFGVAVGFL
jgi:hypothetical protein